MLENSIILRLKTSHPMAAAAVEVALLTWVAAAGAAEVLEEFAGRVLIAEIPVTVAISATAVIAEDSGVARWDNGDCGDWGGGGERGDCGD